MSQDRKIEISLDVQLTGAIRFWIDADNWKSLTDEGKRAKIGAVFDKCAAYFEQSPCAVPWSDCQASTTVELTGPEGAEIDLSQVQLYDPQS